MISLDNPKNYADESSNMDELFRKINSESDLKEIFEEQLKEDKL